MPRLGYLPPYSHLRWKPMASAILQYIKLLGIIGLLAIGSFISGRAVGRQHEEHMFGYADPLVSIEGISTSFSYDRRFAVETNNESNGLWMSIFPLGGGFIQHPSLPLKARSFAVYHQLHCLDAIRHGYWAARGGITPNHHGRPAHVRYCIDYLRQSLMCHSDTNLEPVNEELNGVTGFGSEKHCRNYTQLSEFAQEWR
ncbi:hypothetical protein GGR56DRAFT_660645 [Xylariaceae sp. FL0804]|nr:hypothetical protein GGR56DRAFT_660645 [Xylariaceae sp. FL0804]